MTLHFCVIFHFSVPDNDDLLCTANDKPCVFPFIYNGVEYTQCTRTDHEDLWCSTLNYRNGEMRDWWTCSESKNCGTSLLVIMYRNIPNISPGLIEFFKHILECLHFAALIFGGPFVLVHAYQIL